MGKKKNNNEVTKLALPGLLLPSLSAVRQGRVPCFTEFFLSSPALWQQTKKKAMNLPPPSELKRFISSFFFIPFGGGGRDRLARALCLCMRY